MNRRTFFGLLVGAVAGCASAGTFKWPDPAKQPPPECNDRSPFAWDDHIAHVKAHNGLLAADDRYTHPAPIPVVWR